jgi:hypothetical protein
VRKATCGIVTPAFSEKNLAKLRLAQVRRSYKLKDAVRKRAIRTLCTFARAMEHAYLCLVKNAWGLDSTSVHTMGIAII